MEVPYEPIKCPNCGTVFQVDESQYHEILQQVRNEEFEKELKEREKNSNQVIQSKLEKEFESKLNQKILEIKELQSDFSKKQNDKEQEIISLKEQLKSTEQIIKSETEKAYQEQLNKKELEIKQLQSDFNQKQNDKEQEVISLKEKLEASTQLTKTETQKEFQNQLNKKDLRYLNSMPNKNRFFHRIKSTNLRLNKNTNYSCRQRKMKFKL